ncbi:MAG: GNAT family N-acetyltransferase [Lachnospiraceae bacterium]|nr:GNAT family N-acetyltransferase [Lachnospiraceae bacterium]
MDKSEIYLIRRINHDELDMAFALIWRVFQQFVAPDYTDEGVYHFYKEFITGQNFRDKFLDNRQMMYGSFDDDRLIGVLSISNSNHISCLFVDGNYHRKGVATKLLLKVTAKLKQQGAKKIKLNATPYAIPFYHAIGFADIGTENVYHGIRYTPMELSL